MHNNPYTQENARNGAMHYLMGRGAAGVAGFLTVILLVRFMDVENYAAYTALSGLVAMCGVLSGLGMERVISRYVPEGRLYHSSDELGRFVWMTSAIRLIAGLLVTLALYFLWPAIDRFLVVSDFKFFSIALACFIVAEVMFQHFSSVLQALVMQKKLTQLLVIQWAGRLVLIAVFVFMNSVISWENALWVFAIPEVIGVVWFVVVIKHHLHGLSNPERAGTTKAHWPNWVSVADVGMHNYGFTLLAAPPQGYFMKLLTSMYLPAEIVAAYGFFISIAEKARQYIPLHFFYGLLEPIMVASYLKDRDFSALSQRCQLLYKSNLLLMVPAIAWVAIAGDPIVSLMTGGKFQGLSWILLLVMVQLTIGSHVVLLQLILNSLEKSRLLISASSIALPTMLIAMAIAIVNAPIALLISPILFSIVMNAYILSRLSRLSYPYYPSWLMISGVILSGMTSYAFVNLMVVQVSWNFNSLMLTTLSLFLVVLIYTAFLWLMRVVSLNEINLVKSMIINKKI
jgi:pyruvyl transferase EpsO